MVEGVNVDDGDDHDADEHDEVSEADQDALQLNAPHLSTTALLVRTQTSVFLSVESNVTRLLSIVHGSALALRLRGTRGAKNALTVAWVAGAGAWPNPYCPFFTRR